MQLLRPNPIINGSFGYKYFWGAQVAKTGAPLKHVNCLLQLILGIAQPEVAEFVFYSAFCKKYISKGFIFSEDNQYTIV